LQSEQPDTGRVNPVVIPRPEHNVSRAGISRESLKVLYRLKEAGYQAFMVGGGVRDLLLGREPKDIDVVTDARPEQVKQLFRNSRLIGRRFRLAHVHFGREYVEVATFRANADDIEETDPDHELDHGGRIIRDNVYGTIDEDVWRRDFTANALYYNIADFSIWDYCGGAQDVRDGILRLIGDPETRYREDPVRMLRAVRFAAKLGFRLHPATEEPVHRLASLIDQVPPARLFEEVLKLFQSGHAASSFDLLQHFGLFKVLFPESDRVLSEEQAGDFRILIQQALNNTDSRIAEGLPVTPTFLFAVLLWGPIRELAQAKLANGMSEFAALNEAGDEVIAAQQACVSIPRRFFIPMREMLAMQPRFLNKQGKRATRLLGHPRFRAAYDFMLLRAQAGEVDAELAQWWTDIQTKNPEQQGKETGSADDRPAGAARKRRRRRRPRKAVTPSNDA
jgi:poly(A) polymerase